MAPDSSFDQSSGTKQYASPTVPLLRTCDIPAAHLGDAPRCAGDSGSSSSSMYSSADSEPRLHSASSYGSARCLLLSTKRLDRPHHVNCCSTPLQLGDHSVGQAVGRYLGDIDTSLSTSQFRKETHRSQEYQVCCLLILAKQLELHIRHHW
jgi:hypothetical protein